MEKAIFPVLVYTVAPDLCVGLVVGQSGQWAGRDWPSLPREIEADLRQQQSRGQLPEEPDLSSPRLKILPYRLQQVEYQSDHTQLAAQPLPFRIPMVYGKNRRREWVGYAPWLLDAPCHSDTAKSLERGLLNQVDFEIQDWDRPYLMKVALLPDPELKLLEIRRPPAERKSEPQREASRWRQFLTQWAEEEPMPMPWFEPAQAWQRGPELTELADHLKRSPGGLIVVGERGSGKSHLIRQALRQLSGREQERPFTAWRVQARRLPAGVRYMGEWQGLVEQLVRSLRLERGILWLDDPVGALQSGGETPESSLGGYLQMFLEERKLRLVTEATPSEWEQIQQRLPGLARRLHPLLLEPLRLNSVRIITDNYARQQFQTHRIRIRRSALEEAYRLTNRFLPQEQFPGKVIRLLTQCLRQAKAEGRKHIDRQFLIRQFAGQTGLPEWFLRDDLQLDNEELLAFFEERIVGQPEAVRQLTEVVKVFKAGLNNPQKPITTLVFAGPTGVGKTASAEALASFFFGTQARERIIRLDMSELQYPNQIDRLIGNVFREDRGHLAGKVRDQPFSVVLLDEIEKATPLVFDTLLNILDEGLLVDSFGRLTHFRNSIIIMTTNLGADLPPAIGFGPENTTERYRKALRRHFRPEFVNRIDDFVFFRPLRSEHLLLICRRELDRLRERSGLRNRDLQLTFSDRLVSHLAEEGYHEKYGARPLQRSIERQLVTPLAEWLLDHPEVRGKTVAIDLDSQRKPSFTAT